MALQFQPNILASLLGNANSSRLPPGPDDTPLAIQGLPTEIESARPNVFQAMLAPEVDVANHRPRRSALDILGGLADVIATTGGAQAQYQSRLDAGTQRQQGGEDRAVQQQLQRQQIDANNQNFKIGDQRLSAGQRDALTAHASIMGQAARGLAAVYAKGGAPAAQRAWPLLAKQLGIPDEDAAAFAEHLAAAPEETITALSSGLNDPKAEGSLPKELQVYQLLQQKNPTLADKYLENIANGDDAMSAYQKFQASMAERNANYRQGKDDRDFNWRTSPNNPANQRGNKAGQGTSAATTADASALIGELGGLYDQLHTLGATTTQSQSAAQNVVARVRNSALGQLGESGLGTAAQVRRDRIAQIQPALVQAIAKATGMTSKQLDSNADVKLALQQVTDPTRSYEANKATISYLQKFIQNHKAPAGGTAPRQSAPAPRGRAAPASSGGWKVVGVS